MAAEASSRVKEMLADLRQIKEREHLSAETIHEELNLLYLHPKDRVGISTVYRWLEGTPPRGEATLALSEWIEDKKKKQNIK